MSDRITLKGVSATGFHGVLDFEKRHGPVPHLLETLINRFEQVVRGERGNR